MALNIVSAITATSVTLSSFLDMSENELRNPQIHNLSTTQINSIATPVKGQLAFDSTLNVLKAYDGTAWDVVGANPDGTTLEISGGTLRVKDDGITYAKIQNVSATNRILGRDSAGAGAIEEITPASLRTMINVADGATANTGALADADTVGTAEIDNLAVTSAKLAAASVTSAKLDTSAVTGLADVATIASGDTFIVHDLSATALGEASVSALETYMQDNLTFTTNTDVDVNVANLTARLPQITESVTIGDATDVTVTTSGGLIVTGNLTVNGTTVSQDVTTIKVEDPVMTLGGTSAPATDDNKDRGIEFHWHNGTTAKIGFFGYDDSTGSFVFIADATNTSEVFSGSAGDAVFGGVTASSLTLGGTAITSTADELNILDGVTATTAELNIIDGVTATTAELNILDGVTSTTAELNILDGVTATTAELNLMDGVTATTAELNYVDGVTSNVQTQLDARASFYKGQVTVSTGSGSVAYSTHGILYPAVVQMYDSSGNLVLADIRQTTTGDNDISISAEDATYDIIITGDA